MRTYIKTDDDGDKQNKHSDTPSQTADMALRFMILVQTVTDSISVLLEMGGERK